jgi:rhomboid protease GluP
MVLAITAFASAAQFVEPALLPALERTPSALHQRQYWRLLTPLFVHSDGWSQIAFNFPAIAVTGYFAERVFGARLWLILYFVSGFAAEFVGYVWQPTGAGASVAGAGLLGALTLFVLLRVPPPQAKFGALLVLLGAIALTGIHNIHGPPILVGGCIALIAMGCSQREKDKLQLK